MGRDLVRRRYTRSPDLVIHGRGGDTVFLLQPKTRRGSSWIAEHLSSESQWLGDSIAVEHRYVHAVVVAAVADGLAVS